MLIEKICFIETHHPSLCLRGASGLDRCFRISGKYAGIALIFMLWSIGNMHINIRHWSPFLPPPPPHTPPAIPISTKSLKSFTAVINCPTTFIFLWLRDVMMSSKVTSAKFSLSLLILFYDFFFNLLFFCLFLTKKILIQNYIRHI